MVLVIWGWEISCLNMTNITELKSSDSIYSGSACRSCGPKVSQSGRWTQYYAKVCYLLLWRHGGIIERGWGLAPCDRAGIPEKRQGRAIGEHVTQFQSKTQAYWKFQDCELTTRNSGRYRVEPTWVDKRSLEVFETLDAIVKSQRDGYTKPIEAQNIVSESCHWTPTCLHRWILDLLLSGCGCALVLPS